MLCFSVYSIQCNAYSQNYITNPGFEGPDGIEVIPSDWFGGCGVMNTPDTQPGWWNIENKPAEGNAYIDLLYKEDGTTESVYQKLASPLIKGGCFHIEIYLAMACQDSISGLYEYDLNHPGDLIIRGSETYGCNNGQILAEFKQVSNCQWRKYQAVFHADSTINYIYLEFKKGASPELNGSILIDDILLEDLKPFPSIVNEPIYNTSPIFSSTAIGQYYMWYVDDVLFATDTNQISVIADGNHTIYLTYLVDDTCFVQEYFNLWVKPLVPNIVTAIDKNNINDIFSVFGLTEEASIAILNRWGETVYYENPFTNHWSPDITVPGVYFYRLELFETGRVFIGFFYIQ